MAQKKNSVIQFSDWKGKSCTCRVSGVADLTKLITLAGALGSFTRAQVDAVTFSTTDKTQIGSAVTGKFDTVNLKAVCWFEDSDAEVGGIVKIELPCPLESKLEQTTGNTYVVTKTAGDALAADLSTATGKNLRFLKGRLDGTFTKPQA